MHGEKLAAEVAAERAPPSEHASGSQSVTIPLRKGLRQRDIIV